MPRSQALRNSRKSHLDCTLPGAPEAFSGTPETKDELVAFILNNTRPGSIILLHPNSTNDEPRKVIPEVVQQLQAQGYTFVTVSELLSYQGK